MKDEVREVKIEVKRNKWGTVWYNVRTEQGDYGTGETLQEALDSMTFNLPMED